MAFGNHLDTFKNLPAPCSGLAKPDYTLCALVENGTESLIKSTIRIYNFLAFDHGYSRSQALPAKDLSRERLGTRLG